MVAVTGELPVLTPAKDAMSPVPDDASPIDVLLFVQLNTVPPTVPLNVIPTVDAPLHTVWYMGSATVGVGLTVMVNTWAVPRHVTDPNVYSGVTVIVATTGEVPALAAAKAAMLPVPLAASPIEGVLLVQL